LVVDRRRRGGRGRVEQPSAATIHAHAEIVALREPRENSATIALTG